MKEFKMLKEPETRTIYKPFDWTFNTKEVAEVFDTHVEQSVPFYKVFHNMIGTFAQYYIEPHSQVVDVGCSTGKLLTSIAGVNNKPVVQFVGIDTSQAMIDKARECSQHLNVSFLKIDACKFHFEEASFVYSMLCMQFVPLADREDILKNIYNGMKQGGAFVMVEKVKSSITDVHDIYNDIYYDFKRSQGLTDTSILDKNVSLRGVMKPLTLETNVEMLKEAGFSQIEVFMKYNNFAGIIAIK